MARHVLQPGGSRADRAAEEILKQARRRGVSVINARQVRREWCIAGLADKSVEKEAWAQLEQDRLMRRLPKSGPDRKARDYELIGQRPMMPNL